MIFENREVSDPMTDANIEPYENARRFGVMKRQHKVLVIDDESTGRAILAKIVEQVEDDIIVAPVNHPLAALDWLDNHHPDMIITDYRMPCMDGVELIRRIRQKSEFQDVPIMMITVVSEKSVRYDALEAGATAFLTRPIDRIECRTSCRNLLKLNEHQSIIKDRADWLARQIEVATEQVVMREREALLQLARAGQYREDQSGLEARKKGKAARIIAEFLDMNNEQCNRVEFAAALCDIGKQGISDDVLLKPGKLDQYEWAQIREHTKIGYSILADQESSYLQTAAIVALNHHERYDGSGYPNQLYGTKIPLVARIAAVADVCVGLLSSRCYRAAWKEERVRDYLLENSGTQLDPLCIEGLLHRGDYIAETIDAQL